MARDPWEPRAAGRPFWNKDYLLAASATVSVHLVSSASSISQARPDKWVAASSGSYRRVSSPVSLSPSETILSSGIGPSRSGVVAARAGRAAPVDTVVRLRDHCPVLGGARPAARPSELHARRAATTCGELLSMPAGVGAPR